MSRRYQRYKFEEIAPTKSDGNIQVDIMTTRSESLVYHDHCVHIKDLKVLLSFSFLNLYSIFQIPEHMNNEKVSKLQPMSISVQNGCTDSANTVSKEVNSNLFCLFPI